MNPNWWEQTVNFTLAVIDRGVRQKLEILYNENLCALKTASRAENVYWIKKEDFRTATLINADEINPVITDISTVAGLFEIDSFAGLENQALPKPLKRLISELPFYVILPLQGRGVAGFFLLGYRGRVVFDRPYLSFLQVVQALLKKTFLFYRSILNYERLKLQFKGILEAIPHAVIFMDDKAEYCWINKQASSLLGIPYGPGSPALVSQAMEALRSKAENKQEIEEKAREVFKGKNLNWNWIYSRDDKQIYSVRYIPVSANRLSGVLWLFEDITSQYEYELKLQQLNTALTRSLDDLQLSNERYQIASSATNDAIWDWDVRTDSITWSEGYERISGIIPKEAGSRHSSWFKRLHPEDQENVAASLKHIINDPDRAFWKSEYRYLNEKSQTYLYVKDRGAVIRDKDKNAVRMVGSIQDITELKQKELEIILQNEKLQEIANLNSHHIRKPVANILGLIDLLHEAPAEDVSQLVSFLRRSSVELDGIIKEVAEKARY